MLFPSRWPPGPDRRGPRTENHVVSEVKDDSRRYGNEQNKAQDGSI